MASAEMDPKKSNIVPFTFYIANLAASQSAVALATAGEATAGDVPEQPCPWAGSIVGQSVQVEAARSAGTLTVQPEINAAAAAATTVINADNTQYNTTTWNRGEYPVTAGQRIGARVTTDADWAAGTTPSVVVTVFVHIEGP
jgi:hypothetical protein